MKNSTIRWIVIGATVSIIGIVTTQVYWVKKAFALEEQQFDQGISVAMLQVAKRMAGYNQSMEPLNNPVKRISGNYYIVNINDEIDANILEHYIIQELNRLNIVTDFEYGIYDCSSATMVYGDYISLDQSDRPNTNEVLPKYSDYTYYFGIRFPQRSLFIADQMGIWIFSTIILFIVVIFFASTILVILRQKRLSEVQKDFINNMTHEFKTPISTISIAIDVLRKSPSVSDSIRLTKYADVINSEINRLHEQVQRVLQMAKIDRKDEKLNIEPLNLVQVLSEIVNNFKPKIESRQGRISLKYSKEFVVKSDEVHLVNILGNLVENAILYSDKKPEIRIDVSEDQKDIVVRISDNGIGIAKEHQRKIFDKFYRVPKGNVHDVKGFGLGLNYVLTMLKTFGWKITLESTVGVGSVFTIRIPKKNNHGKET